MMTHKFLQVGDCFLADEDCDAPVLYSTIDDINNVVHEKFMLLGTKTSEYPDHVWLLTDKGEFEVQANLKWNVTV